MSSPIARRSTLKKASVNDDVVADLVGHDKPAATAGEPEVRVEPDPFTEPEPDPELEPEAAPDPGGEQGPADAVVTAMAPGGGVVVLRRGPGRPRSRRRMEPFSSKLEIGLRDQIDEYLQITGESIVDFLDRSLRNELAQWRALGGDQSDDAL